MAKSSIKKYKSFEKWRTQEVENEFQLERCPMDAPFLQDFLSNPTGLTDEEKKDISALQIQLRNMIEAWNEYDMSILFIGPIFNIVQSQQRVYRTFFNHSLKIILNNKEIAGRIDGMLAKGWQIPEKPLFFMQEHKSETGPNGDPLGQLLIEMVAAQAMNKEPEQALYGCYIIGRNWFFVVLQEKDYAVSNAYVATDTAIFDIVGILKKIKKMFEIKIGYIPKK
jgi:hypothetical protein